MPLCWLSTAGSSTLSMRQTPCRLSGPTSFSLATSVTNSTRHLGEMHQDCAPRSFSGLKSEVSMFLRISTQMPDSASISPALAFCRSHFPDGSVSNLCVCFHTLHFVAGATLSLRSQMSHFSDSLAVISGFAVTSSLVEHDHVRQVVTASVQCRFRPIWFEQVRLVNKCCKQTCFCVLCCVVCCVRLWSVFKVVGPSKIWLTLSRTFPSTGPSPQPDPPVHRTALTKFGPTTDNEAQQTRTTPPHQWKSTHSRAKVKARAKRSKDKGNCRLWPVVGLTDFGQCWPEFFGEI